MNKSFHEIHIRLIIRIIIDKLKKMRTIRLKDKLLIKIYELKRLFIYENISIEFISEVFFELIQK